MNNAFLKIFGIYVFFFAFLFGSRPPTDADIWFHLKTGQYILENGAIPRTEMFSFTNFGVPFVAHGWLSGLLFYATYSRLGFFPIMFGLALITAVAFWIVFKRCQSHTLIAGFATLLAAWAAMPTLGIRPRIFTLLFSSVYLAVLGKYARDGETKAVWWLVPLMTVWVNLHGGFLYGFALIAVTIVGLVVDAWAAKSGLSSVLPRIRTLLLVLSGCLAAGLINPYGYRLYTFPLGVLKSSVFQNAVIDWRSPDFHIPQMFPLALLILLVVAAFALSPKRVRPSELLLLLGTMYATLKANRHLAIFTLVAAPIVAEHLHQFLLSTSLGHKLNMKTARSVFSKSVLVSLVLLLPLVFLAVRLKSTVYGSQNQARLKVPMNAVQYMRENSVNGNTFTDPNVWGAYVSWELPSNRVYVDGRDVYPESFVRQYVDIIRGTADWRQPFSHYGVDIALVRPKSILARELRDSSEWSQLYEDEVALVFRRNTSSLSASLNEAGKRP